MLVRDKKRANSYLLSSEREGSNSLHSSMIEQRRPLLEEDQQIMANPYTSNNKKNKVRKDSQQEVTRVSLKKKKIDIEAVEEVIKMSDMKASNILTIGDARRGDIHFIDQMDTYNAQMRQASTNFHADAFKGLKPSMHAIMEVEDAPEDKNYYLSQEEEKRQAEQLQNSVPIEGNENNFLENDEVTHYSNVKNVAFKSYASTDPSRRGTDKARRDTEQAYKDLNDRQSNVDHFSDKKSNLLLDKIESIEEKDEEAVIQEEENKSDTFNLGVRSYSMHERLAPPNTGLAPPNTVNQELFEEGFQFPD